MMNQNYNTNRDYKDVVILLITPENSIKNIENLTELYMSNTMHLSVFNHNNCWKN